MSEIVQRTPQEDLIAQVRSDGFKREVAMALPENITPGYFVRVTVTALMQTPDLAGADRASFFQSLIKCAQDGLLPDGREAALVLFSGKVQYLPMVGGIRKKLAEFGWTLEARCVYEGDEFDYEYGLEPHLTHRPPRPGTPRGARQGVYAVAKHKDGRRQFTVLDEAAIAKIRAIAKTKTVWDSWPDPMAEKTAAKQLANDVPLDPADREQLRTLI